jgi:hypothetical protein
MELAYLEVDEGKLNELAAAKRKLLSKWDPPLCKMVRRSI